MTSAAPRVRPSTWAIAEASTRRARGRGLLGRTGLDEREGLWLPVRSVHTFGMRFAIDLVWLDRGGRVLRLDVGVGRGRVRTCLRARGGVVEVAAGSGDSLVAALDVARSGCTSCPSTPTSSARPSR